MFRAILGGPCASGIAWYYFAISILFIATRAARLQNNALLLMFFYFYFIYLLYQLTANTRHSIIVLFVGPRALYIAGGIQCFEHRVDGSIRPSAFSPRNSERRSESNVFRRSRVTSIRSTPRDKRLIADIARQSPIFPKS